MTNKNKYMITHERKHQIAEELQAYADAKGSQNKAANSLNGVSSGTISQVLNHNWELINDAMWNKIARQIKANTNGWQFANTGTAQTLTFYLENAKNKSMVMAITAAAGTGKTSTTKIYSRENDNVYHLNCNEYWDRKWFLQELLKTMGKDPAGMNMPTMMERAVTELQKVEQPQIILDEADKLRDQVLYFFITLYNRLEDNCSIILMATHHLQKRIERGLSLNKRGYAEIYSRLGKRFVEAEPITLKDVVMICGLNGVTDNATIKEIWQDCDGDVRRVKRLVQAERIAEGE